MYKVHGDWKWGTKTQSRGRQVPLPGITWAEARRMCNAEALYPQLDARVVDLHAWSRDGGVRKCLRATLACGCCLECDMSHTGVLLTRLDALDISLLLDFAGDERTTALILGALYRLRGNAPHMAGTIDLALAPVLVRCAGRFSYLYLDGQQLKHESCGAEDVVDVLGDDEHLRDVVRIYAVLALALYASLVKQLCGSLDCEGDQENAADQEMYDVR